MPTPNQPYSANHKTWDHQGHLLPQVEYSESIRPHGEFLPAAWLPLAEAGGYFDVYTEEYYSVLPGKVLAMSRDGKLVPAGLLRKFKAASASDVVLQYTQADLDNKVVSLKTNEYVTTTDLTANSSTGWRKSDLETALKARGLLKSTESLEDFVSAPVGVAPYGYFNAFSYDDPNNPVTLRNHNMNLQHRVAILCDYVLELPWVPEVSATSTALNIGTVAADTQPNTYYVQFTDVTKMPIAAVTEQTPWTFVTDTSSSFLRKKNNKRDVRSTGDYFVDDALQRLYFYNGSAIADASSAATGLVLNFYHYNSSSDVSTRPWACVMGPIQPGDYLMPTPKSNYIPVTKANAHISLDAVGTAFDQTALQAVVTDIETAIEEQALIIGQVIGIQDHPKSALNLARSYGERLPASSYLDKMPGSATEGLPDKLTYAGGANKTVRVNIHSK